MIGLGSEPGFLWLVLCWKQGQKKKIRSSSSDHSRPIAAEVVGQSSAIVNDLIISLCPCRLRLGT